MSRCLFVCLGNICRSPMAEGIFQKKVAELRMAVVIDSAATSHWEDGNPVHPGTKQLLIQRDIDTSRLFSRQITQEDFATFDWIIGMDQQNVKDLVAIAPAKFREKIHLYMEVVPGKETNSVPDPWFTGDFEETERMIDEGLPYWLARFAEAER